MKETLRQFAFLVYKNLFGKQFGVPSVTLVERLVDVMFWSSLKTEELSTLRFSVILANPERVDSDPPEVLWSDRWKYIPFELPIECTVHTLAKLGNPITVDSGILVVYPSIKNELVIWGLIDQELSYHKQSMHENTDGNYARPAYPMIKVIGPGHMVALKEGFTIAEYRLGELIHAIPDVLTSGPIKTALFPGCEELETACTRMIGEQKNSTSYIKRALRYEWVSAYKRLLCTVRDLRHGGTLLISGGTPSQDQFLNCKYKINYSRIYQGLIDKTCHSFLAQKAERLIWDNSGKIAKNVPASVLSDYDVSRVMVECANSSLDGAIQLVSSMTKHDGAVILSSSLQIYGFGFEITENAMPQKVSFSKTARGLGSKCVEVDSTRYGTRHRSAMRYCWHNQGSVALIASQDGEIRAATRVGDKVVVWENIQVNESW